MRDDTDNVLHPANHIGAQAALATLNKYMTIMGESDIYWMATGTLSPYLSLVLVVPIAYNLLQHSAHIISSSGSPSTDIRQAAFVKASV
jgi:hypothetical protein